ncbi:ribosome small subunit-dependent GTPase A [Snodgrassella alvi]|uniref:ribosome small subunit-dependent GTPase A n=1 Tax=Snodgrassella alvi TaxID=1196083 RepID=UPI0009FC0708|nr:ribosome small subunit-dependent GTPase A [Snodgrassella alvi]ORF25208.1 ribosome small subunit-dependent GTPase A [Snodgrassella alvi]ORF31306.1 ribosome small subunit-dependent GTPase A [Snodgrassella alvi]ORF34380.1 ribosome small subunit-dependent GTPase A [Snodgrassella alvi]ORF36815.1 ribosome small subunit-dependent GTPase A [Snodgrassella alvi]ORF39390.1 ribosome small subunit-dependent GTPase A [Snodgrassella alvi]
MAQPANELLTAQIITSFGRRFMVRTHAGKTYEATTRKKRVDFACGDEVHISHINQQQAVIEDYLPRRSLLYRQDATRSKLIAANVTLMLIVLAAVPTPSELLLQRALLAAEAADILPLIVLNKADLPQNKLWLEKLAFYQSLGYQVINISALYNVAELRRYLQGERAILLGQSGMGKSTLTNALLGNEQARVGDISAALDSGRHTTTHAQLYDLDAHSQLIDSPGLQAFGLHHLSVSNLLHYFPDMRQYIGKCRFHNCTHRQEPGCALKQAAADGKLKPERLQFLQSITDELTR